MKFTSYVNRELTPTFWKIITGIEMIEKYGDEALPQYLIEAGEEWCEINDVNITPINFFTKENLYNIYEKYSKIKSKEVFIRSLTSLKEEKELFLICEFSQLSYYNEEIYFGKKSFTRFLNFILLKRTTQFRFDIPLEQDPSGDRPPVRAPSGDRPPVRAPSGDRPPVRAPSGDRGLIKYRPNEQLSLAIEFYEEFIHSLKK